MIGIYSHLSKVSFLNGPTDNTVNLLIYTATMESVIDTDNIVSSSNYAP